MKKFICESYTEWHDNNYWTVCKVYADIPQEAADAIAEAEEWDGCHWDNPRLVYCDAVIGTAMSDEATEFLRLLEMSGSEVRWFDDYGEYEHEAC